MKPLHLAALLLLAGSAHATYSVGSTPPDFTCNTTRPDLHGTSWNLNSQHGKVVMINFGAVWCGPCNAEFPYLQSEYEAEYDPAVFELVHIDVDNEPATYLNNHWQQYGISFPLLMGCGSLFGAWGAGSIPHTVVLDADGIVRGNWIGFSTGDIPVIQGVIETWLPSVSPMLSIDALAVGSDDDSDGRAEAGETVSLSLRLENAPHALTALATTATLSTANGDISLEVDSINFPAINEGTAVDGPTEFVFTVDGLAGVFQADFTLTLSSTYPGGTQPHVIQLPVQVPVGWPDWLVVDSDGTADDNENWITGAFETLSLPFDLHTPAMGAVDAALLAHYPRVLWAGGIDTGDISVSEAAALAAYMDGGGRLLVSSQHGLNNGANAAFYADYFHVSLAQNLGVSTFLMQAVADDPFFGGTQLLITGSWRRGQQPGPGPADRPGRRHTVHELDPGCRGCVRCPGGQRELPGHFPRFPRGGRARARFLPQLGEPGGFPVAWPSGSSISHRQRTTVPVEVSFRVDMHCADPGLWAGGVAVSGTGPVLGEWAAGAVPLSDSNEDGVFETTLTFPAGSPFAHDYRFQTSTDGVNWVEETGLEQHRHFALSDAVPALVLPTQPWNDGLCAPVVHIENIGGGQVRLSWDAIPGAFGYLIHAGLRAGFRA
jgi:thiol-disulfide isomerase/thioredoxin